MTAITEQYADSRGIVTENEANIDDVILKIFEGNDGADSDGSNGIGSSSLFYFPVSTQREAREFVKELHSRGVSYRTICDEISEFEHNFTSWRTGLGRQGIGNRVIERINRPVQEVLLFELDDLDVTAMMTPSVTAAKANDGCVLGTSFNSEDSSKRLDNIENSKQTESAEHCLQNVEPVNCEQLERLNGGTAGDLLLRDEKQIQLEGETAVTTSGCNGSLSALVSPAVTSAGPDNQSPPATDEHFEKVENHVENLASTVQASENQGRPSQSNEDTSVLLLTEEVSSLSLHAVQLSSEAPVCPFIDDFEDVPDANHQQSVPSSVPNGHGHMTSDHIVAADLPGTVNNNNDNNYQPITETNCQTNAFVDDLLSFDTSTAEDLDTSVIVSNGKHAVDVTYGEQTVSCNGFKLNGNAESSLVVVDENYNSDDESVAVTSVGHSIHAELTQRQRCEDVDVASDGRGFIYAFTDTVTQIQPHGVTADPAPIKYRVKVGTSRCPGSRLRQAALFNVDIRLVSAIEVSARQSAVQAVKRKISHLALPGAVGWFVGPLDDIMTAMMDASRQFPMERNDVSEC